MVGEGLPLGDDMSGDEAAVAPQPAALAAPSPSSAAATSRSVPETRWYCPTRSCAYEPGDLGWRGQPSNDPQADVWGRAQVFTSRRTRQERALSVDGIQSTMKRRAPSAVAERCGMLSSAT